MTTLPTDVKELIPEFYAADPSFLLNLEKVDFGTRANGESCHEPHMSHDHVRPLIIALMKSCFQNHQVVDNSGWVMSHTWVMIMCGHLFIASMRSCFHNHQDVNDSC